MKPFDQYILSRAWEKELVKKAIRTKKQIVYVYFTYRGGSFFGKIDPKDKAITKIIKKYGGVECGGGAGMGTRDVSGYILFADKPGERSKFKKELRALARGISVTFDMKEFDTEYAKPILPKIFLMRPRKGVDRWSLYFEGPNGKSVVPVTKTKYHALVELDVPTVHDVKNKERVLARYL